MVERVQMMSSQPGARRSDAELKAIYDDRYAAEYDPHAVPRIERMRPFFELSRQDVVADFGCGNGVLLEVIGPSVRQYLGVDFSDAFVRAAEQRRDARGPSNGTFYCADIIDFCRQRGRSCLHPASSCKMGMEPGSVVDDRLRVHGLRRLRVVDGSIMPLLVGANPNAATIMIAEKGAEMILADDAA